MFLFDIIRVNSIADWGVGVGVVGGTVSNIAENGVNGFPSTEFKDWTLRDTKPVGKENGSWDSLVANM